ncbi:Arc-like DNA binding domain-containing protein [Caballeronia sp. S22]
MPTSDTTTKTSVRLPKALHAELERAAEAAGLTVNGEMVYRLQHDPRREAASALLAEIEKRDLGAINSLREQNTALWNVIARADGLLEQVIAAMAQVKPGSDAAALKREVEFVRELISATKAHR